MRFEEYVSILKRKIYLNKKKLAFICIGNSEILWDSIGPKVGSYLKSINSKINVFGTENNNICSKLDLIKYQTQIKDKFLIAIDVGIIDTLIPNDIYITNGSIEIGSAFDKNKGKIGNLSIKAGISNWRNISKEEINYMSFFISKGICKVLC